ncbi:hypothetical protein AJ88_48920 [Mesorhizobium amorphae CCBAU 01583]|nr:hypothetical protein AJ88_48920 [Mesorhizobium amorphae CCBAU 01583]
METAPPLWHAGDGCALGGVASTGIRKAAPMEQLSAQTRIVDGAIRPVMDRLRAEHGETEIDTGIADQWEFRMHYGSLNATLDDGSVLIRVAAEDETCLSYMKMTVAGHFSEHLGTTNGIRWQGDGSDAGTPVFFREIRVVSATRISPHMQPFVSQAAISAGLRMAGCMCGSCCRRAAGSRSGRRWAPTACWCGLRARMRWSCGSTRSGRLMPPAAGSMSTSCCIPARTRRPPPSPRTRKPAILSA